MRRLLLLASLLPALAACDRSSAPVRDDSTEIEAPGDSDAARAKAKAQAELDAVARRVLEDRVARLEADMAVVMARVGAPTVPPLHDPTLGAVPPPIATPPIAPLPEPARERSAPPLRYELN